MSQFYECCKLSACQKNLQLDDDSRLLGYYTVSTEKYSYLPTFERACCLRLQRLAAHEDQKRQKIWTLCGCKDKSARRFISPDSIFINGAVGSLKLATYSNSNARELASGEILKVHLPIDNFSNNYEEFLLQN